MKTLLIILFSLTQFLYAEDLQLKDGTVLRNVSIISATPKSMLVVHDGGGLQLEFSKLAPSSLSVDQRTLIESSIREHVERTARVEKLQLEKQVFEQAQREKGLILFEDGWMKPIEREEILAQRAMQQLEREKARLALEKEKAELKKQQQLIAQGDRLLQPDSSTYISISSHRSGGYWYGSRYPVHCYPYSVNKTGRRTSVCFGGSHRH